MSDNSITTVMSRMLEPVGLDEGHLNKTLGSMMSGGVDYADLYFQVSRQESWAVEDRIIREGSFSHDQGVGVRAVSGEKTGFAYSDELMLPALEQAASAARAIARQGESRQVPAWQRGAAAPLYPAADGRRVALIPEAHRVALWDTAAGRHGWTAAWKSRWTFLMRAGSTPPTSTGMVTAQTGKPTPTPSRSKRNPFLPATP